MDLDGIEVRKNEHGYDVTINDYHVGAPLQFWLSHEQAADLRAQLSPKLMRYPRAVTPAKWQKP